MKTHDSSRSEAAPQAAPAATTSREAAKAPLQRVAQQDDVDRSPRVLAQRQAMDAAFRSARPQAAAMPGPAGRANETGLPDALKSGIESLSSMDISQVRVHRNSDKPAQLNALAYAQGDDIHLAPGQEQHLPHEAWHVVQQRQGRVRPTLQMQGVDINDAPDLEAEADTMGGKAARLQAAAASVSAGVESQASVAQRQVEMTPRPASWPAGAVAQRSIHEYSEGQWRVVEPGTAGTHRPAGDGASGLFFNDVTNRYGHTRDEVRAGLVDRMMHVGSLPDLSKDLSLAWTDLGRALDDYCTRTLPADSNIKQQDRMINIGSLYLSDLDLIDHGQTVVRSLLDKGTIDRCSNFVHGLMRANGQLDFIRGAAWWKPAEMRVRVDMNYYHNRPLDRTSRVVGMHKDTAGDNLFVNLVFGNEHATPATEWTQDRVAIAGAKLDAMKAKGVPEGMLTAFQEAKATLEHAGAPGKKNIEGGVMPKQAFVSWVDELAWHATPSLLKRATVPSDWKQLESWFTDPVKIKRHPQGGQIFFDALSLLHGSNSNLFDNTGFLELQSAMDDATLVHDWYCSRFKGQAQETLKTAWLLLVQQQAAKMSGLVGNSVAPEEPSFREGKAPQDWVDPTPPKTPQPNLMQPTGIAGRTRSNSDADVNQQVNEAADKQNLRSFIRTWVRIEPIPGKQAVK
jgi:hypothetical protein